MTLLEKINGLEVQGPVTLPSHGQKEWMEKRRAEKDAAFRLADEIALDCRTDREKLRGVLEKMARFPQYSAGNLLLIQAQKPDATYLADYSTWKDSGAFIRKGEQGINVIEAGGEYVKSDGSIGIRYNVKKIFDVSQIQNQNLIKDPDKEPMMLLKALIESSPCEIELKGSDIDPYLQVRFYKTDRQITVNRAGSPEEMFRELSREIAKALLSDNKDYEDLEQDTDFTAECASYVLCTRYGIEGDTKCFSALPEGFTGFDSSKVKAFLSRVRYTSGTLTQNIEKNLVKDLEKAEEMEAV